MVSGKQAKKKPSRVAYEESHPTVSLRLDRETHDRLREHLRFTNCTFADFVKDSLGREERVAKLVSKKTERGYGTECAFWTYLCSLRRLPKKWPKVIAAMFIVRMFGLGLL